MDHNNIEEMIQHYDYLMVIVDPFSKNTTFTKICLMDFKKNYKKY